MIYFTTVPNFYLLKIQSKNIKKCVFWSECCVVRSWKLRYFSSLAPSTGNVTKHLRRAPRPAPAPRFVRRPPRLCRVCTHCKLEVCFHYSGVVRLSAPFYCTLYITNIFCSWTTFKLNDSVSDNFMSRGPAAMDKSRANALVVYPSVRFSV